MFEEGVAESGAAEAAENQLERSKKIATVREVESGKKVKDKAN